MLVSRRSQPIALTLLFLSGFTGLVYEFAWSKRMANLLGNSGEAHAIVLATFMGGLALGAWLLGRAADRSNRPLLVYAALELGVGLYALVLPWVIELLGSVYLRIAPQLSGGPRVFARLILAASTLLAPTVLMGGTLPAMTRYLSEGLHTARRVLSRLYATNSLGAAVGCLLAGMVMVPSAGLAQSERFAAGLNLLLGLVALVLGWRARVGRGGVPSSSPARVYGASAVRAALIGTAIAGFTSMLYEVTWIRLLAVIIGGTSFAFTLILSAFILGIALGSFWISRRPEGDALRTFGWLQLALVGVVCLALPAYPRLPYVFLELSGRLSRSPEAWLLYQGLTFAFCAALLVPPAFVLGASFPSAARVAMASVEHLGSQLGRAYLWNTVGTVLGSLLGGLWLLPAIGLEGNFIVGLLLNLAAGGLALRAVGHTGAWRRWGPLVAAGLAEVVFVGSTRGWATMVASAGRYREWGQTFPSFADFRAAVESRSTIRFYQDDVFASVLVGEQTHGRRFMRINGKVDASNGADIDTQILAGQLGVLTHPGDVKKVLLIGVGAGVTAGSLLAHPIERLDVVEISPAVVEAARLFSPDNRAVLDDARCRVHIEDARTFLALSQERYDLIVSVPSNPWVSGVSGLFSRDFFRVARDHLAEGGRLVQWINTYESNEAMVRLVVRTLRDSFEHGTTWLGPADLLFIASRTPQSFEVESVRQRIARPAVASELERIRTREVTTLLARQVHSDASQAAFAGEGPINTDDHNLLEYGSPIAYFSDSTARITDDRTHPSRHASLELSRWTKEHPLTAHQLEDAWRSLSWVHPPDDALVRATAEGWLLADSSSVAAATAVASAALAQRDPARASTVLTSLIAGGDRSPRVVALWLQAQRGALRSAAAPWWNPVDVTEAVTLGRSVAAQYPGDAELQGALDALEAAR